ncbi:transcriptional regulator [Rossellomorea vietnamensis]|uniref:Transcriptional regulator n=1 Tax=Rossellomorea vietnamensis TaxID=218284 RepID=A0ACD4C5L4_9BACI|nr:transcriptional regulator [Rossellomorea vietnamensis]UXH43926.1 transcriptional regulator [Rossellomorea vietnamensis]
MKTKIALIGSREFIERIEKSIPYDLNSIELVPYMYDEPQEASKLMKNLTPCDAVLFSGALPYFFSQQECRTFTVPVLYLEQDETALVTSLLYILHHHGIEPDRVSIDLMDRSLIDHAQSDLHLKNPPRYVMDYKESLPHNFHINDYTEFHQQLFQDGQTEMALTSIHAVYDRLVELHIPCMRMIDPAKSLIRAIDEAHSQSLLSKRKAATIAAARLSVQDLEGEQERIHELARLMKGTLQKNEDDASYTIYSNRGSIEHFLESTDFHEHPMLAGFGYGHTATEAEANAEIALSFARKADSNGCAFILNEEKELSGPYPDKSKKQHLKNDTPEMLSLAKQLTLSPANLSKLVQFYKSRSARDFTAAELSDYMQITRRSTERILKKLVDNGSAKIIGEEMTYAQGRPRAIYELTFPIY